MEFEWNGVTLSVNFYGQFIRTDYPFHIAYVQPPPPLRKNRRRGVCGGGGDCTQASLRRISHF